MHALVYYMVRLSVMEIMGSVDSNRLYVPHLESNGAKEDVIPVPNPWRLKANGRIIRHVPITLYSDDTSGNTSKQFNKHISFFFTLCGLPPNVSNQEYHCHFLASSNISGVLELSKQVVEELK